MTHGYCVTVWQGKIENRNWEWRLGACEPCERRRDNGTKSNALRPRTRDRVWRPVRAGNRQRCAHARRGLRWDRDTQRHELRWRKRARPGRYRVSASAPVQPSQSPSETDDDSDMNTVTMPVEVGGARVLMQVRRSEFLYSECPGWGSAGTARAIGLALRTVRSAHCRAGSARGRNPQRGLLPRGQAAAA